MDILDPFERTVADLIIEPTPDDLPGPALEDALAITGRMRPLPRWLALVKEPPMHMSSPIVTVGSPTVRVLAVLGLVVSLIIVGVAGVGAASVLLASPRPLPPYGRADNGSVIFERLGDIWLADADGVNERPLISGPAFDVAPWYSRDGSRIAYFEDPDGQGILMVADADGRNQRQIVDHALSFEFMPDGRSMVGTHLVDGQTVMSVIDIANGTSREIPLGDIVPVTDDRVMPRPPAGAQVVFTGWPHVGDSDKGIFVVSSDGRGVPRQIGDLSTTERADESGMTRMQGGDSISFQEMVVAPDGETVAYWDWEMNPASGEMGPRIHQRDLTTGAEVMPMMTSGVPGQGNMPHYTPDASAMVFEGSPGPQSSNFLFQGPANGMAPAAQIGPPYSIGERQGFDYRPDGASVAFTTRRGDVWLVDTTTGETRPLVLKVEPGSLPVWQRVAP